jgi:hypothetical protein
MPSTILSRGLPHCQRTPSVADDIHAQLKLRRDDVVINLVECVKENWSFGGGIAQYAE